MITKAEFQRRVEQNTAKFKRSYRHSADPAEYHLFDAERGTVRPMMLLDKVYDIFAAVSIGALAVMERSGEDAMMLRQGKITPIELKFVKIDSSRFLVGPRGGIYKGGRNSRTPLNQCIQAQYVINNEHHLQTKHRYTVCVVYDQATDQFIEARGIGGDVAVMKLESQTGSRRLFYWDTFQRHGEVVPLAIPHLGYDKLEEMIRNNNTLR